MPTSSVGSKARGITLLELMVALVIIVLIIGISFAATMGGLENIRLAAGARSAAAFINIAANRAERLEQAVELTVSIPENSMTMRAADLSFTKKMNLPPGITLRAIWPAVVEGGGETRQFVIQPGGALPRIGVELANHRGVRRLVRLNPITGVAEIEQPAAE